MKPCKNQKKTENLFSNIELKVFLRMTQNLETTKEKTDKLRSIQNKSLSMVINNKMEKYLHLRCRKKRINIPINQQEKSQWKDQLKKG